MKIGMKIQKRNIFIAGASLHPVMQKSSHMKVYLAQQTINARNI